MNWRSLSSPASRTLPAGLHVGVKSSWSRPSSLRRGIGSDRATGGRFVARRFSNYMTLYSVIAITLFDIKLLWHALSLSSMNEARMCS